MSNENMLLGEWISFNVHEEDTRPREGELIVAVMDHLEHGWCMRMGFYNGDLQMIGMPQAAEYRLIFWLPVLDDLPVSGKIHVIHQGVLEPIELGALAQPHGTPD